MDYPDDLLRDVLNRVRSVAVVGASPNPARPSHSVSRYLLSQGYRVLPVNPGQAGRSMFGTRVAADLADLPEAPDMIDIFRRSEHAGAVVDQALDLFHDLIAIWMQLGVRDPAAAKRAEARGVIVIQDRCPAIERPRLFR